MKNSWAWIKLIFVFSCIFSVQTQTHYKPSSPWFQNVHIVSNAFKSEVLQKLLFPLLSPFLLGSLVMWDLIVSKMYKQTYGPLLHQCAHGCVTLFAGVKHWQPPLTTILFLLWGLLGFLFLCGWKTLMLFEDHNAHVGMFLPSWLCDWSLTHCKLSYKVNYKW